MLVGEAGEFGVDLIRHLEGVGEDERLAAGVDLVVADQVRGTSRCRPGRIPWRKASTILESVRLADEVKRRTQVPGGELCHRPV